MDLNRTDRIGELLTDHLKDFIFDELSEDYLKKAGVYDILKDVPVPIRRTEMTGITVLKIALNMAYVIGCDPSFKYRDNYIKYILKNFDKRFSDGLLAQGMDRAEKGDYEEAVIDFRAAILVDPQNANAYYCYGRGLKDVYESMSQADELDDNGTYDRATREEIIGRYKAESIEAFEIATDKDPDMADGYYYLGYAYLNMGLYVKAKLVWDKYIELSEAAGSSGDDRVDKARKEAMDDIRLRLRQLEEPIRIEEGYNLIISGRYEEGIKKLKPYTDTEFKNWWPLWFYLGTAYKALASASQAEYEASGAGNAAEDEVTRAAYEEACDMFTKVLRLDPSNRDAMNELVSIYSFLGNEEMADKYRKKIAIVAENAEADRELARERSQREAGLKPTKLN